MEEEEEGGKWSRMNIAPTIHLEFKSSEVARSL